MIGLAFEDERYVRLYTRDTPDWLLLGWEARALFVLLERKLDRAGVAEMGRHEPAKAVAALVGMPVDVVSRALPELLAGGFLEVMGERLVDPVFIEAQEAKASDAARARASRERRRAGVTIRDGADTPRDAGAPKSTPSTEETNSTPNVTPCDTASQPVTERHAANENVTPSLAVPSLAERESTSGSDPWGLTPPPSAAEPVAAAPSSADADTSQPNDSKAKSNGKSKRDYAAEAARVFEFWKQDTGHPRAKFDTKRKARIVARLKDDFSVKELEAAIRNRRNDPWLMGTDPKSPRVFDELETLLRDVPQVERLRDLTRPLRVNGKVGPQGANTSAEEMAANVEKWTRKASVGTPSQLAQPEARNGDAS